MASNFIRGFYPQYKLAECCEKGGSCRPEMEYIHFENGYAYATDAHVCVRVKVADISNFNDEEIERLNGQNLLAKAFKEIQKNGHVVVEDGQIVCDNMYNKTVYELLPDGEANFHFPNVASIMQSTLDRKDGGTTHIGISAELVSKLQKATDCRLMRFDFNGEANAIKVTPAATKVLDFLAIIMPCLCNEKGGNNGN